MELRRLFVLTLLVLGLAPFAADAQAATRTLTVTNAGGGTVTSSPAGINCGSDCSETYNFDPPDFPAVHVTLTATPDVGMVFTGWSGACSGTGSCQVTMSQNRSVTATFAVQTFTLSVSLAGTGSGTVTSAPAGINCGVDCSEVYDYNTVVALTATPATGSTFTGWSGDCTGTGACNVTMDQARSVTATFTLQTFTLSVSLAGAGSGTVTSSPAGINCGVDCSEVYDYNTVVALTATPAVGSVFDGWSGDCTGTGACNVTMDQARSVTATFSVANFELTVSLSGAGSGSVSSSPAGIDCGSDCSETYDYNTEVTLTATPDVGSVFGGWGGDCTGTGTCVVTMDQAHSVTATFEVGNFVLSVAKAGDGAGTVTSAPAGIDCGVDCSESYDYNTVVSLTATPYPVLSAFTGWSGDCTGTGACNVTMDQARSVTATFEDLGLDFFTVTPCRVIDTRLGTPLTSGVPLIIDVAGNCGIPATAKGVSVNLTAIPGASGGVMTLYPGDAATPNTYTISFNASNNRADNAQMGLASNGDGTLAVVVVINGGGTMNMVLDINGYFE